MSESQTENRCNAVWRDSGSVAGILDMGSCLRVIVVVVVVTLETQKVVEKKGGETNFGGVVETYGEDFV